MGSQKNIMAAGHHGCWAPWLLSAMAAGHHGCWAPWPMYVCMYDMNPFRRVCREVSVRQEEFVVGS